MNEMALVYRIKTSSNEESEIANRIWDWPKHDPMFCASAVNIMIKGIGPFQDLSIPTVIVSPKDLNNYFRSKIDNNMFFWDFYFPDYPEMGHYKSIMSTDK